MEKKGKLRILRPETAQIMISMLRSVIKNGTARSAGIGRPAAGKTGSTNNWRDAWFVGFTPQLTTCVWMGYDTMGLSLGIGQSAAGVAAPVWSRYMKLALQGEPVLEFPVYAGLQETVVCAKSGLLPTSSCHQTINEIFPEGTVPEKHCDFCSAIEQNISLTESSPDENISANQRSSILKNIKKKKSGTSVLEGIGNDLLR